MGKLTEVTCRNAKCEGQKIVKLGDGDGLYLWVYADGRKSFNFRYKWQGKEKGLSLGTYPKISLSAARRDARKFSQLIRDGIDPSEHRKSKQNDFASGLPTFEEVAMEWYNKQKHGWTPKHASDVLRRLRFNIFPKLGKRAIAQIEAPDLLKAIQSIEERGATDLSHRVNGVCGQVFRYGIASGKCKYDLAAGIIDALKPHVQKNQPAVSQRELPALMKAINNYDHIGAEQTKLGLLVLAHTFPRTNELIEARKTELDFDNKVWEVPHERMKGKLPHIVPLTDPVIGYFKRLLELSGDSEYILPGNNALRHMSDNTLLFALYRLGYKSRMTGHGFRAVASTILNEVGFNPDAIERQLAHVERNKVRGAYNRALYMRERREMMVWWSSYLISIAAGEKPVMPSFYAAADN